MSEQREEPVVRKYVEPKQAKVSIMNGSMPAFIYNTADKRGYSIQRLIATGTYGIVYKATCKKTKKTIALKVQQDFSDHKELLKQVIREVNLMSHLTNAESEFEERRVTKLIDIFCPEIEIQREEVKTLFIVMEYTEKNLYQFIRSQDITEDQYKQIFYQLACLLNNLHQSCIIHRDFKSSNILIDKNLNTRVCDYGLSRTLPESCRGKHKGNSAKVRHSVISKSEISTASKAEIKERIVAKSSLIESINQDRKRDLSPHVTTRWYRAPEICVLSTMYDQAIDIWSFGCVMVELLGAVKSMGIPRKKRSSLLPGKSSLFLSPLNKNEDNADFIMQFD